MSVLIPMTETDFPEFVDSAIRGYAADNVASGLVTPAESLKIARAEFDKVLAQGLATPDHHLFAIVDGDRQITVGFMWVAVQERAGRQIAYVYWVYIKPEHQRNGYARRALVALEDVARGLGLPGISLQVFVSNTGAHALYRKLGYRDTNVSMFKTLRDDD